jgi:multidrug transporter EmrE-like cation transporter
MIVGIVFAFFASVGVNLSNLMEKQAVGHMEALSFHQLRHLLRQLFTSRLWTAGCAIGAASVGLLLLSYSLIPIAVVQSIFGVGLGVLVIAARLILREHLTRQDYIGLSVIVAATILVAITLTVTVQPGSAGSTTTVEFASALTAAIAAIIFYGLRRRESVGVGLSFGLVAGLLYGIASLQTKAAAVLIHLRGIASAIPAILESPYPYLFAATSILGVFIFQAGLQRSEVALLATVTNAISGVYTVGAGSIIFREGLPRNFDLEVLRFVGFAMVLVGGGILATGRRVGPQLLGPETSIEGAQQAMQVDPSSHGSQPHNLDMKDLDIKPAKDAF